LRWREKRTRIGDTRLSLDAALLHMEAGSAGKAETIAQADLRDAAYDEPAAAIAWDAGDFPAAIERLSRLQAARPHRAEAALLFADVSQALGRTVDAEKALARALPLAPQLSWTPYANLAYFAGLRGEAFRRPELGRKDPVGARGGPSRRRRGSPFPAGSPGAGDVT
jgi:Flp pilus assembly protein TadD